MLQLCAWYYNYAASEKLAVIWYAEMHGTSTARSQQLECRASQHHGTGFVQILERPGI